MTWSADFARRLSAQTVAPIVLLHVVKWAGTPGRQFYLASAPGYGVPEAIGIDVQISGSSLTPGDWRYTHGTCSVEIVSDSIGDLAYSAPRGAICIVKMGFPGYALADFEPVFMGRVSTITGSGKRWQMQLWDGTSILMSRLTLASASAYRANRNNLFFNIGGGTSYQTTLAVNYSAGASTLDVVDASVFEKLDGAGTTGAVSVDNGTDPAFFLTYTGVSGNQLTGVSTSNMLGTEQKAAVIGDTASGVAYLEGTPRVLFLRQLLSGSGTSTLYDKMPDSWGYGLPRDLVDVDDVVNMQAAIDARLASGSYSLSYGQLAQVTDSYGWLSDFYRTLGLVPIQRQGLLTLRPIQDPNDLAIISGAHITDDAIDQIEEWNAYHPDMQAEYQQVEVSTGVHDPTGSPAISSKTSYSVPSTLPVADTLSYLADDKIYQNQTAIADEIKSRVGVWGPNLAETVRVRCAGLRFAGLVATEIIHLTTSGIYGGRINSTREGYDSQPCMVLSCSPDYAAGTVLLILAAIDPL